MAWEGKDEDKRKEKRETSSAHWEFDKGEIESHSLAIAASLRIQGLLENPRALNMENEGACLNSVGYEW